MGTVFLATQESLGREVALKILGPEFTRDDEFLERFRREGRTAGKLRHPNIVQAFDLGESDGCYFIAMEYGGSLNLKQVLSAHPDGLPADQALKFTKEILSALDHAHQREIVHRDVKPANIIINDEGQAMLTDFSVAHMKSASRLTQTGAAIGTPEYMAPEQFEGGPIDGRADIYALGIILYEMLTGVQPFHGETMAGVMKAQLFNVPTEPRTIQSSISQKLNDIIMKSLEKDAGKRFSKASEMLAALNQVNEPAQPQREATLEDFLAAIASGKISLDEANAAREQVKVAIDQGYRKHLTIMMVDLAGSSKIKIPNQTLHADRAFRDYRASINSVLNSHGVSSFDWSGDGAICIFNDPLPAVKAAAEIQGMVEDIATRHPSLPDKLRARIGINTGEVYLDPRRGLGEFASRTVDQAGHLEKDCPVGAVQVSEATMKGCDRKFRFTEIGLNRDQVLVFQLDLDHAQVAVSADTNKIHKAQPKFCPGCGKPIQPGRRICPECNYELGSLTSEPIGFETTEIPPLPVSAPPEQELPKAAQLTAAAATAPIPPAPTAQPAGSQPVQPPMSEETSVPGKASPKLDLSSGIKSIQNAPKGFVPSSAPKQVANPAPKAPASPPTTAPASASVAAKPPSDAPSGLENFLVFASKAMALGGLGCFLLALFGAYLHSQNNGLWVVCWGVSLFGLACSSLGSGALFLSILVLVRKLNRSIQSGLFFVGLLLATIVAWAAFQAVSGATNEY